MDGFLTETDELLRLERECRAEGFCFVAGVDEVGRGPLAGPVVAAAVVFPRGAALPPVNDSKQLTELERETLRDAIYAVPGIQIGIGEIDVETIDRMNILNATHLAMRRAVEQLKQADFILVDGRPVKGLPLPSRAIVKGDAKSASIAAASIIQNTFFIQQIHLFAHCSVNARFPRVKPHCRKLLFFCLFHDSEYLF